MQSQNSAHRNRKPKEHTSKTTSSFSTFDYSLCIHSSSRSVYTYSIYCVIMLFYKRWCCIYGASQCASYTYRYTYSCESIHLLRTEFLFLSYTIATSKIKSWRTYCLQFFFSLWRWLYSKLCTVYGEYA